MSNNNNIEMGELIEIAAAMIRCQMKAALANGWGDAQEARCLQSFADAHKADLKKYLFANGVGACSEEEGRLWQCIINEGARMLDCK
jgi:hypothetical protein